MNRNWRRIGRNILRVGGVALMLALTAGLLAETARAGDAEGVTGYSIRLKNKDFQGAEGAGSQLTTTPSASGKTQEQAIVQLSLDDTDIIARVGKVVRWRWLLGIIMPR